MPEWFQGRNVHQDHMDPVRPVVSEPALPGWPNAVASKAFVAGKKQCSHDETLLVFRRGKRKMQGSKFATRLQKYVQEEEGNHDKKTNWKGTNKHC